MDNTLYWIWLSLAVTPGSETFSKLLGKCSSVEDIYNLDRESLVSIIGSRSKDILALSDKNLQKSEEILAFCKKKGVGLLTYGDHQYPKLLKKISNPPVLLYYRGILPDFDKLFCVSMVGARKLSNYGRRNAFNIAFDLSRAGATVVSGMAKGIDGVSHAGAIAAGKRTIAVLGSGIDVCYPKEHIKLAREIVKAGCVFSEYPPGTPPNASNFPVRNRIISGLSEVTLVIEGTERSGALHTARHAKEQERVVYALPGNVGNINSELSNLLIKKGALLCTAADDIVRDFENSALGKLNSFELAKKVPVDMNAALSAFAVSAVSIDDKIFKPSRSKREFAREYPQNSDSVLDASEKNSDSMGEPSFDGFDSNAIKIYQRIPQGKECNIEDLVDSEIPLRVVMKGLLKLEMGKFIVMLPGEKVRRKF